MQAVMSERMDLIVQWSWQLCTSVGTLSDGIKILLSITTLSLFIVLLLCWHVRCGIDKKLSPLRIPIQRALGHADNKLVDKS